MLLASSAEVLWRGAEAAGVAGAMIEAVFCMPHRHREGGR
jgi:hypothetical protein